MSQVAFGDQKLIKEEANSADIKRYKSEKGKQDRIRILDKGPQRYSVHYIEAQNIYTNCSKEKHGECPVCDELKLGPSVKFSVNILHVSRGTEQLNDIKIWQFSQDKYNKLANIMKIYEIEDLTKNDMIIDCEDTKFQRITINIPPKHVNLEKIFGEKGPKKYDLEKINKIPSPAEIRQKLNLSGRSTVEKDTLVTEEVPATTTNSPSPLPAADKFNIDDLLE